MWPLSRALWLREHTYWKVEVLEHRCEGGYEQWWPKKC